LVPRGGADLWFDADISVDTPTGAWVVFGTFGASTELLRLGGVSVSDDLIHVFLDESSAISLAERGHTSSSLMTIERRVEVVEPATTHCSTLGDDQPPSLLDQDVFHFTGTSGETVTLTLAVDPDGTQTDERATLLLTDQIAGVVFMRLDSSALPNTVQATLPATGAYRVTVAEHPDVLPGPPFLGAYCVTLESSGAAWESFMPTASVEGP
jgi:hypothetical protein